MLKRALTGALALPLLLSLPALAQESSVSDRSTTATPSQLQALGEVAAAVVRRVTPSIVQIEVERASYGPRALTRGERMVLGIGGGYDPRYFSRPEGPCSGVAIGPDLVATTTWNLAGEDDAVFVITPDGRRLPAERLGRDENLDVALLRVKGAGLPVLSPARGTPQVGRFLFLIGRTENNTPLVTRGIVSGHDRYRGDAFAHSARTSFQTAGGALVDLEGRLVGISVRHSDRARQAQNSGVGFGAQIGRLEEVQPRLAQGEVIPRRKTPFLGIAGDTQTTETGPGVRIGRVIEDTAAEKAGLKAGDWIKIFNNVEIESFIQLREEIQSLEIGSEIVVTILRGEEELDIRVQLGGRVEDE